MPNEDQGYGFAVVVMPDAASLERTTAVAERVDAMLAKIPGVEKRSMINGYSLIDSGFKTNAATFFITFRDFKERYASIATASEQNARTILTTLYREVQAIEGATVFPAPPPPIPGIGTTGGFEFWVQDTTAGEPARLDDLTQEVIRKAAARPELTGLHTTFRSTTQQLRADVDRDKATLLGVPVEDVYSAIQAQFGSMTVSQFNQFSQVWWVILQSDAKYRQTPEDLTRLYTRSNQGYGQTQGNQTQGQAVDPDGAIVGARDDALGHRPGPPSALQRLPGSEDHRQRRARLQLRAGDRRDGSDRPRGAAAGLHVRVVGARVRGEESGRDLDARVRVRADHRVSRARRAVRIVDVAGRGHDCGAVRGARARSPRSGCAGCRTMCTSRSACSC